MAWCSAFNLRSANQFETREVLHSPARQLSFLIGLLLATPEPAQASELTEAEWSQVQKLLGDAFSAYQLLYYPSSDEVISAREEWTRAREVAMPAFLHYLGSDLMASTDQVEARVRRYLVPFDEHQERLLGISATDALPIAGWISDRLQHATEELQAALDREKSERIGLLDKAKRDGWSLAQLQEATRGGSYPSAAQAMFDAIERLGRVKKKDILTAFPKTAEAFWRAFVIARGKGSPLSFPTERTEYDLHPLILRDAESAYCPSVNALFVAILRAGESLLAGSSIAAQYYRRRDKLLEAEGHDLFRRYFGEKALIYTSVFERPDTQFEHDIVILYDKRCLVVEAKAAPPIETFRDPDRAFARLRQAFRADTGIQSAFNQANNVLRRLRNGEIVSLYDEQGKEVVQLDPKGLVASYAVCLTRDDHGPLATNLNLLLDKSASEPYPWVVNVFDFTTMCEAREYWGWAPSVLFEYLDERLRLHGKAFTTDELDLYGYRLRHGTLDWIRDAKADLVVVSPHYAEIFDQMYRARLLGEPRVEIPVGPPVLSDLRASLKQGKLVTVAPTVPIDYPRNKPCPCGSGRKYKNCCGRRQ